MKKLTATNEHELQRNFFNWVRRNRKNSPNPVVKEAMELCHSVPNGWNSNSHQGQKMKMEGLTAGIPDIHLPLRVLNSNYIKGTFAVVDDYYIGFWIETKYKASISPKIQKLIDTGNYLVNLSPEQKRKRELLIKTGHKYVICYSVAQMIKAVMDYLPFEDSDYIEPKYS